MNASGNHVFVRTAQALVLMIARYTEPALVVKGKQTPSQVTRIPATRNRYAGSVLGKNLQERSPPFAQVQETSILTVKSRRKWVHDRVCP